MGRARDLCQCKECKAALKRGLILGSRYQAGREAEGVYRVSDYVPYHKAAKGRARREKKAPVEIYDYFCENG